MLNLSRIGLGTWAMGGGGWKFSWGPQDDKSSIRTIHKALELGVNWIDTAPLYGFGHAETIVGKALRESSFKPAILTKCGLSWNNRRQVIHNLSSKNIRMELEDSLKRLKRDSIDIYNIHWPSPSDQLEEGWRTIQELIKEGKVRFASVSNFSIEQIELISNIAKPSFAQNEFSFLNRNAEQELIPYCRNNNIQFLAYGVLGKGVVSGQYNDKTVTALPSEDHRKRDSTFLGENLEVNLKKITEFSNRAAEKNKTSVQEALSWALAQSGVNAVVCGMRSVKQVIENLSDF